MSMFDKYNNLDPTYVPNNRPILCKPGILDIMTGETASHNFDVPFNIEEEAGEVEVIYKLGLDLVIVKNSFSLEIYSHDDHSIITCELKPNETLLFKSTVLSARVQLKFYMNDGNIVYSEIYPVKILNSLDSENRPQSGTVAGLKGFGWTED